MFKDIFGFVADYVEGIKLLALFDKDGFIVEKVKDSSFKSEEIAAEFSSILKYIDKVTTFLVTGKMGRMIIECDNDVFYLHKINKYYYVVAVLEKNAIVGKLKYALTVIEPKLKQDLEI
jgi:predicted regulator of Ras-like GTPase activity (Roadblock/LC7/MglB family)